MSEDTMLPMVFLALGLIVLGEWKRTGIYFLLAVGPLGMLLLNTEAVILQISFVAGIIVLFFKAFTTGLNR